MSKEKNRSHFPKQTIPLAHGSLVTQEADSSSVCIQVSRDGQQEVHSHRYRRIIGERRNKHFGSVRNGHFSLTLERRRQLWQALSGTSRSSAVFGSSPLDAGWVAGLRCPHAQLRKAARLPPRPWDLKRKLSLLPEGEVRHWTKYEWLRRETKPQMKPHQQMVIARKLSRIQLCISRCLGFLLLLFLKLSSIGVKKPSLEGQEIWRQWTASLLSTRGRSHNYWELNHVVDTPLSITD